MLETAAPGRAPLYRLSRCALLGAGLVLGCASIFGIDQACVIGEEGCADGTIPTAGAGGAAGSAPCTPGEPGCSADAELAATCSEYCDQISQKCAATPQYDDARPEECQSLCRHFPRASGESPVGNTLECRVNRINSASGERSECFAAGRSGDGTCGSSCDAYCSLMQALCPANFSDFAPGDSLAEDAAECSAYCARLRDRGDYDPALDGEDEFDEPGDATVQCRLWHLGTASIEVERFGAFDNGHCDHAVGVSQCNPTPPP